MLIKRCQAFLSHFAGRRVVVLGDLVADEYILGQPERISREAPVLILNWQERYVALGGATNTANNIVSLGGKVELVGVVGEDEVGKQLRFALKKRGIGQGNVLVCPARPTTVKTRILAGGRQDVKQQLVRIDKYTQDPLPKEIEVQILRRLAKLLPEADALLISDYNLGVMTDQVKRQALALARQYQLPVAVDSRHQILTYKGASIVTPNLEEARGALGRDLTGDDEIVEAAGQLLSKLNCEAVIITRGEDGMTLKLADGQSWHLPALNPTQVFDVTGAGDTVIGTLTLALAAGASYFEAAVLANLAAGLVVRKLGTATVSSEELEAALAELANLSFPPQAELKSVST